MESSIPSIYGFAGAFFSISLVTVCARLYTRRRYSFLGWDDLAIAVGLILFLNFVIGLLICAHHGLGHHIQDVDAKNITHTFRGLFATQIFYPTAAAAVKLSITLFLVRILPSFHKWIVPLYCIAGWVVIQGTSTMIVLFLQCRPMSFYWDKSLRGHCINQTVYYYVDTSLNIAVDAFILSLPWIFFYKLQLPKIKKYGVLTICSLGIFTLGTSVVRLPFIWKLTRSKDPTWDYVNACNWSVAELGSAITLSSIPATMPLIRHHFPNLMPSTIGSTSKAHDRRSRSQHPGLGTLETPHQDENSTTCLQLDDIHATASSVEEDYRPRTGREQQVEVPG